MNPTELTGDGRQRSARPDRAAWGFLFPFVALFLFVFVLPLGYALHESLLKPIRSGALGLGLGLGPATIGFAGLDNYTLALQQSDFLDGFGRVLLFGIVRVSVMLLLATALALILDTLSQRWAGILRAAHFLPYGVPGIIASILWGFLYVPGSRSRRSCTRPRASTARAPGRRRSGSNCRRPGPHSY